jgi:hypothetical protein
MVIVERDCVVQIVHLSAFIRLCHARVPRVDDADRVQMKDHRAILVAPTGWNPSPRH